MKKYYSQTLFKIAVSLCFLVSFSCMAQIKNKNKETSNQLEERNINRLDSLLRIQFVPTKKYADALFNNKSYNTYLSQKNEKCKFISHKMYEDIEMKEKVFSKLMELKDGHLYYEANYDIDDKKMFDSKYFRNKNTNLVDSIIQYSFYSHEKGTMLYKYLPDRYISWVKGEKKYIEILLDKDLKPYQEIHYDENGDKNRVISYKYDENGYFSYVKEETSEYVQEGFFKRTKDEEFTEYKKNGKLIQTTLTKYINDCEWTITLYDEHKNVVRYMVYKKAEPHEIKLIENKFIP